MSAAKPSVRLTAHDKFPNGIKSIVLKGRPAWASSELKRLGSKGLRSIDCPATQLPFYIWQIRQEVGDDAIVTHMEEHGGPFSGRHARYVLVTPCEIENIEPKRKKPAADSKRASNQKTTNGQSGGGFDV